MRSKKAVTAISLSAVSRWSQIKQACPANRRKHADAGRLNLRTVVHTRRGIPRISGFRIHRDTNTSSPREERPAFRGHSWTAKRSISGP